MKCRNCDYWDYEEDQTNDNAGICDCSQSPRYGDWTYPNGGCNIDSEDDE